MIEGWERMCFLVPPLALFLSGVFPKLRHGTLKCVIASPDKLGPAQNTMNDCTIAPGILLSILLLVEPTNRIISRLPKKTQQKYAL